MTLEPAHARRRLVPDEGLTLVELIVAVAVGAVILAVVASGFVSGIRSEETTRDRDTATGKVQLVNDSLQQSVRNATALSVSGSVLRARVVSGSSAQCRAWVLTSGGELRYTASGTAISIASTSGWRVLATGVSGTLTGSVPFSVSGRRVTVGLTVAVGDAVVPLKGAVSAQAKTEGAAVACW